MKLSKKQQQKLSRVLNEYACLLEFESESSVNDEEIQLEHSRNLEELNEFIDELKII